MRLLTKLYTAAGVEQTRTTRARFTLSDATVYYAECDDIPDQVSLSVH